MLAFARPTILCAWFWEVKSVRTAAIVLAIIFVILAIYYVIPGPSHPLTSGNPTAAHYKHVVLFVILAVLSLIGARFTASSANR